MSTPYSSQLETGIAPTTSTSIPVYDSGQMFGADEKNRHAGDFYRLRVTHQNKLILTK
ncbi:hemin uptake protein HemP [Beggiatoa alba]|nr:hemin uptake protein HemP [bacterium AH-315-E07]MBN4081955.1 hemin uptake protein HemP [Beggiatoa alba]